MILILHHPGDGFRSGAEATSGHMEASAGWKCGACSSVGYDLCLPLMFLPTDLATLAKGES